MYTCSQKYLHNFRSRLFLYFDIFSCLSKTWITVKRIVQVLRGYMLRTARCWSPAWSVKLSANTDWKRAICNWWSAYLDPVFTCVSYAFSAIYLYTVDAGELQRAIRNMWTFLDLKSLLFAELYLKGKQRDSLNRELYFSELISIIRSSVFWNHKY